MVLKVADNIYSPLGGTTADNYRAVRQGCSQLRRYPAKMAPGSDGHGALAGVSDLPESFFASLFDWSRVEPVAGFTRFERIVIQSVSRALARSAVSAGSGRLLFVLSTTKGNVELLDSRSPQFPPERVLPGVAAQAIARYFGFVNPPLVVSNACASGLSAQLTAMRLLESGQYDVAVVCGADVVSRFVISGFSSLKALSPVRCRPFDIERMGLNLGEAAATIIYVNRVTGSEQRALGVELGVDAGWQAVGGAVCNDAYHISSPSPTGDGCCRAIRAAMGSEPAGCLAFVSAHGTATMYNDEMESAAISRAGLSAVPVNSLKGYYGHTMGAAGVLETVLSMAAVDHGCVLQTLGYEELGVSHSIRVAAENLTTTQRDFLKLMSGFGGCNAAMRFRKLGT